MNKLKISEIFYSLQGEGLYIGTPSIFIRLFGCNFTCAGFGVPRGQKSEERFNIDPNSVTKYEDLPLVKTGCDSYASWDPRFKHLSPMMTVDQIVAKTISLLPDGRFGTDKHLIITGGEPLLPGWQKAIPNLIDNLRSYGLEYVTFETNGTQEIIPEFKTFLNNTGVDITFSVSAKLPVSGEKWEDAIKPDIVYSYYWKGTGRTYLKFVVASEEDVADVEKAVEEYNNPDMPVYLMPVGGTTDGYYLNNKRVAEIAMKNGWRYSPRLQVELFKNQWGT